MTKTHRAYCLRTCAADMTSHGSFVWPTSGPVECPDWHPRAECGNGLHGLLWGAGDGSLLNWSDNAKWLVVGVDEWVEIDSDKVKFPRAEVVFCGDRKAAVEFIIAKGADPAKCVGGTASAGNYGTASAGYRGTASAGDGGTASGVDGTILAVKWWDAEAERYRLAVAYVGEDGIAAGTKYRCDAGKFIAAESETPAA